MSACLIQIIQTLQDVVDLAPIPTTISTDAFGKILKTHCAESLRDHFNNIPAQIGTLREKIATLNLRLEEEYRKSYPIQESKAVSSENMIPKAIQEIKALMLTLPEIEKEALANKFQIITRLGCPNSFSTLQILQWHCILYFQSHTFLQL